MATFYRIGASPLIVTQIFAVVFFGFPYGHVSGYAGRLCKLADGAPGVCTIIDQCTSVYQGLVTYTFPYEDVVQSRCGFVKDKEVVCCKDRQSDQPTGPSNPSGPRNSRRTEDACAKYRDAFGASLTFQILGGTAVRLGEFPHMTALGYPSTAANREYDWKCGATLISDQYLLTAAHCITSEGPTLARLGKISIDSNDDNAIAADYLIEEAIKYPNYTNARQYHDIALLKLNQKVSFTENIRPACLDTSQAPMAPNTVVTVTGWGTVSLRTRRKSPVLLKANLKTVPLTSCNQSHVEIGHNRKLPFGLMEGQMCAFDPDLVKSACQGDSGGPLQIVDDSGMATIYGVSSFGASCASQIPGVYTRVSHYVDWIESIVWP